MDKTWTKVADAPEGRQDRIEWASLGDGGVAEGIYLGVTPNNGKGAILTLEIGGRKVTASAGTVLVKKLARVPIGTMVAIQHLGLQTPTRGGFSWRNFNVFVPPGTEYLPKAAESNGEEVPF